MFIHVNAKVSWPVFLAAVGVGRRRRGGAGWGATPIQSGRGGPRCGSVGRPATETAVQQRLGVGGDSDGEDGDAGKGPLCVRVGSDVDKLT